MKGDGTITFRNAFKQFWKENNLEQTFQERYLIVEWEQIVGKTIASRTLNIFFKNDVLYIKFSSSPLKNEVINSIDQLKSVIEEKVGTNLFKEIRIL